jgi:hypothetical protein
MSPATRAADRQEIDRVLAHGAVIVGQHRQRLAADEPDPFGVGCARQVADARSVLQGGRPDFDRGSGRRHRGDYAG